MRAWTFPIRVRIEPRDHHRWLAVAAAVGLIAGGLMAVFGLPPVDIHGALHYYGIMGPGCGGTRSVWAAMQGDFAMSWRYNPVGIPLVVGAAATVLRLLVGVTTKRWVNLYVRSWPPLIAVGAVLIVALTINQQLHVDLLRTPREDFTIWGPIINLLPGLAVVAFFALRFRRKTREKGPLGQQPSA